MKWDTNEKENLSEKQFTYYEAFKHSFMLWGFWVQRQFCFLAEEQLNINKIYLASPDKLKTMKMSSAGFKLRFYYLYKWILMKKMWCMHG